MTTEQQTTVTTATAPSPTRRTWPLFWIGVAMFIAGPALNFVQFAVLKNLTITPWYAPLLAVLGVGCLLSWAWKKRSVWRAVIVVPFVLLCGAEWFLTLVASRTPTYTGPAQPGQTLPEFSARLADGKPFTPRELADGRTSVLVFYRGRW